MPLPQLLPVLVVNLGALSSGLALGYSAVLLPQIRTTTAHSNNLTSSLQTGQDEDFSVTTEQGSWIASIFGLGAIVGGLLSAALGPRYGRRISLLLLALPDLAAWLMLASPPSLPSLLIARHLHPPQNRLCHPVCRFLTGLAAAGYSPNIQIFVAETCQVLLLAPPLVDSCPGPPPGLDGGADRAHHVLGHPHSLLAGQVKTGSWWLSSNLVPN